MPNFGEDIPEAHDKGEPARGASKESRQNPPWATKMDKTLPIVDANGRESPKKSYGNTCQILPFWIRCIWILMEMEGCIMLVAVVTTAVTTTKVYGPLAPFLGGFALVLLILALIGKEVTQYAGDATWLGFHRVLNMVAVPLGLAVALVLAQHFAVVL